MASDDPDVETIIRAIKAGDAKTVAALFMTVRESHAAIAKQLVLRTQQRDRLAELVQRIRRLVPALSATIDRIQAGLPDRRF